LERNEAFRFDDEEFAMIDWTTLLSDSHDALRTVVAGVPADAWDRPTPCEKWTVTQVLQHAAGDQLGYAAALTGEPGPAYDPFDPSGRPEADPAALAGDAVDRAAAAFAGVAPDAGSVPNPLPQGPMPAWIAGGAAALDAAVHAWDIAVATGQPSPLTPDLAAGLLPVAQSIVEPLRGFAYAAPVPDAGPDPVSELLAYLGRDPRWTA
jgi:uncharacterized protein (TIGR03086 family)